MRTRIARLPEVVVVRMGDDFRPELDALQVRIDDVRNSAEFEEEPVIVLHRPLERRGAFARRRRTRYAVARVERERVELEKRSVVMPVIAQEPVGDRGLRGDGLERRVGARDRRGGVKTWVGDAENPDAPVVALDVLDEPVDRIVRIGRFIDVGGAWRPGQLRPDVLEGALAHVAAAHVLEHQDVPVLEHVAKGADLARELVHPGGLGVVRSAVDEDGVGPARVLRYVDRRE